MQFGYPDPINLNIEVTHTLYNQAIKFLINKVKPFINSTGFLNLTHSQQVIPISFVIASHNTDSIQYACQLIQQLHLKNTQHTDIPLISFAQLMGMKDNTTYSLSTNGYKTYKYVPYGHIDITIPYLIRRADENSSMLEKNTDEEDLKIIITEIWNKFF